MWKCQQDGFESDTDFEQPLGICIVNKPTFKHTNSLVLSQTSRCNIVNTQSDSLQSSKTDPKRKILLNYYI